MLEAVDCIVCACVGVGWGCGKGRGGGEGRVRRRRGGVRVGVRFGSDNCAERLC